MKTTPFNVTPGRYSVAVAVLAALLSGCKDKHTTVVTPDPDVTPAPRVSTTRYVGEALFRDEDLNGIYIHSYFTDTVTVTVTDDSAHVRNSHQDTVYAQNSSPSGSHNHFTGFDIGSKIDSQAYYAGSLTFGDPAKVRFTFYSYGDSLYYSNNIHGIGNSGVSFVGFRGRKIR